MSEWGGLAEAYAASFGTLCDGTVDHLLADTSGPRHLDVGSGTGTLAGRGTALGRTVVAVDLDREMAARSSGAAAGRVVQACLPDLPFGDGEFDAVTANFVVNHVRDPRASMRALARVTRSGGRVAATIWPARPAAWAGLVADAFSAAGAVPLPAQGLAPELDFERSVAGLRTLVEDAGMHVLAARELTWEWVIGDEALWRGIAGGVATVGRTYLAQTPEVQAAAREAFFLATRARSSHGRLRLPSSAAYVLALA